MARRDECTRCGEATTTSYLLCSACMTAQVKADCAAAGVPYRITDPADLAFSSRMLLSGRPKTKAKRTRRSAA